MKNKIYYIMGIFILLSLLQLIRMVIRKLLLLFLPTTFLSVLIINFIIILIYTILIIYICKKQKIDLKIFKVKNRTAYIILSIIYFILFIINIFINKLTLYNCIFMMYSLILIPIFEELLFRGYIWNRLDKIYNKDAIIYIIVTLLFTVWHFGYIDSIILSTKLSNIDFNINIMLYKMLVGFIYGVITGIVRYKTNNTYSSILVHSVMNMVLK